MKRHTDPDQELLTIVRAAVLHNDARVRSNLQRKLTAMTIQRDEWKERATRYRKQILEGKT